MARLLVVDDSLDVVQLLSEMLRREGHEVDVANNGVEALDAINGDIAYDVVISDLIMPELDGFGLVRKLKEAGNPIPIIVLSGGGVTLKSDDALKAVENLVSGVLKKPIKCDELLEKIDAAMSA